MYTYSKVERRKGELIKGQYPEPLHEEAMRSRSAFARASLTSNKDFVKSPREAKLSVLNKVDQAYNENLSFIAPPASPHAERSIVKATTLQRSMQRSASAGKQDVQVKTATLDKMHNSVKPYAPLFASRHLDWFEKPSLPFSKTSKFDTDTLGDDLPYKPLKTMQTLVEQVHVPQPPRNKSPYFLITRPRSGSKSIDVATNTKKALGAQFKQTEERTLKELITKREKELVELKKRLTMQRKK